MPIYKGSTNQGLIYYGSPNTNCLTSVPKNINLILDSLNATVVGSPTISNGVVSGLSSGNYVKTQTTIDLTKADSWEIVISYIYLADGPLRGFCGLLTGDNIQCNFYITADNTAQSDGVWGNLTSSTRLIVGTRYWTKLQFTGSQYILSLSTDGKNFVTQSTINNTAKVSQINNFAFGCDRNTATLGNTASIDLPNCYIKVNNKEVWRGGTGILTLKAGSKVYVPNGKNADGSLKFDEYITSNDIEDNDFRNASREVAFLITKTENDMISVWPNTTVVSGTSTPDFSGTGYWGVWYDTENNIIKIQEGSNEWKTSYGFSLPFCLVSSSSSAVTSIDQIFDWCGFIGSTAFVLPGVKGLIPNGFNADGTYKSIEFTTDTVLTVTRTWDVSASFIQKLFLYNRGKGLGIQNYQTESNSMPTANDWTVWYNSKENIQRWNSSSNTLTDVSQWTVDTSIRYIGEIPSDGTSRITSLTHVSVQPLQSGMPITNVYKGSTLVYRLCFDPVTFTANGTWKVPPGIKQIRVDCVAAQGWSSANCVGGYGGRVQCVLNVTPGQTLYIKVGQQHTVWSDGTYDASDIRTADADLNSRLIVAGAGGACGFNPNYQPRYYNGGAGGGLTGGTGGSPNNVQIGIGGGGGTQTAGGAGAYFSMYLKSLYASAGTFGTGGAPNTENNAYGGYGGAGWYGGGGAVSGHYWAGSSANGSSEAAAGGGSSYTHPTLCSEVVHTQGYRAGSGYVTISMV